MPMDGRKMKGEKLGSKCRVVFLFTIGMPDDKRL